jgi:hypothetical protein
MNYLRQKGLLRYSRKGIQVHMDSLREYLASQIEPEGQTNGAGRY